jgi:hypothetical protein
LTREGTWGAKIRRSKPYSRIIMNLNYSVFHMT